MATIKQVFDATDNVVTISLNGLAADGSVESSIIDNTVNKFLKIELETEITGGNAASSGGLNLYLMRSNDGVNFTLDTNKGKGYFDSVMPNGITLDRSIARLQEIPAYYKIKAHNSDTLYALGASGNSMSFRGVDLSNA